MDPLLLRVVVLCLGSLLFQVEGYVNPVLNMDFPDPCVVRTYQGAFAYATQGNGVNIQIARANDLVSWKWLGDALPAKPSVRDFSSPSFLSLSSVFLLFLSYLCLSFFSISGQVKLKAFGRQVRK